MCRLLQITVLVATIATISLATHSEDYHDGGHGGYSFNKFSGPVSGHVEKIRVAAAHHEHGHLPHHGGHSELESVDYVAKPDYTYAYGVEDPHTGNKQSHHESRDGDTVHGEYSLVEPNGKIRTVKYTADHKNGFQATIHYDGHADHHGH